MHHAITSLIILALALQRPPPLARRSRSCCRGNRAFKAQPAGEVEGFVQASIDRGYAILNNKGISTDERERQFRAFLLSIIDTKRAALFTLGGFAQTASQSDLDAFLATYDDFAAAMYQGYFNWYTDQGLRVANSILTARVSSSTRMSSTNGSRLYKVGFRVRKDRNQKNVVRISSSRAFWLALISARFTACSSITEILRRSPRDSEANARFREAWAPRKGNIAGRQFVPSCA